MWCKKIHPLEETLNVMRVCSGYFKGPFDMCNTKTFPILQFVKSLLLYTSTLKEVPPFGWRLPVQYPPLSSSGCIMNLNRCSMLLLKKRCLTIPKTAVKETTILRAR